MGGELKSNSEKLPQFPQFPHFPTTRFPTLHHAHILTKSSIFGKNVSAYILAKGRKMANGGVSEFASGRVGEFASRRINNPYVSHSLPLYACQSLVSNLPLSQSPPPHHAQIP